MVASSTGRATDESAYGQSRHPGSDWVDACRSFSHTHAHVTLGSEEGRFEHTHADARRIGEAKVEEDEEDDDVRERARDRRYTTGEQKTCAHRRRAHRPVPPERKSYSFISSCLFFLCAIVGTPEWHKTQQTCYVRSEHSRRTRVSRFDKRLRSTNRATVTRITLSVSAARA